MYSLKFNYSTSISDIPVTQHILVTFHPEATMATTATTRVVCTLKPSKHGTAMHFYYILGICQDEHFQVIRGLLQSTYGHTASYSACGTVAENKCTDNRQAPAFLRILPWCMANSTLKNKPKGSKQLTCRTKSRPRKSAIALGSRVRPHTNRRKRDRSALVNSSITSQNHWTKRLSGSTPL